MLRTLKDQNYLSKEKIYYQPAISLLLERVNTHDPPEGIGRILVSISRGGAAGSSMRTGSLFFDDAMWILRTSQKNRQEPQLSISHGSISSGNTF